MLTRRRFAPEVAVIAVVLTTCLSLAAPSLARSTAKAGCGVVRAFAGSGGKSLGSLSLPRDSMLSWSNDGYVFQVFSTSGGMPVNSTARSGSTLVDRGTLSHLQVNAIGRWHLAFTPRCTSATSTAAPVKGGRLLSGTGSKSLGTIQLATTSRITWTSSGGIFLFFSTQAMHVNSTARNGSTVLPAGPYKGVEVKAEGPWTIRITKA